MACANVTAQPEVQFGAALKYSPILRYHVFMGDIRKPDAATFRLCAVSSRSTSPNYKRMLMAGGGVLGVNYYLYRRFKNIWWDHPRTSFHFYRGWRRTTGNWDLGADDSLWFHVDKFGHFFGASLISRYSASLARWTGLSDGWADWTGVILASLMMLEIEIYDGYFEEWGFSIGDLLANEIGALWPLLQRRIYPLEKVNFKISYLRSSEHSHNQFFIEDYGGMTFWFCYDIQSLLPTNAQHIWPDFLDLALGYGTTKKTGGELEVVLALDYDLTKLPLKSKVLRNIAKILNNVHFPSPAIRITPQGTAYLLYF